MAIDMKTDGDGDGVMERDAVGMEMEMGKEMGMGMGMGWDGVGWRWGWRWGGVGMVQNDDHVLNAALARTEAQISCGCLGLVDETRHDFFRTIMRFVIKGAGIGDGPWCYGDGDSPTHIHLGCP